MSTRSSSRLQARVKAEQSHTTTSSMTRNPLTGTDAVGTTKRTPRPTRSIIKNEDGEPDEETLARLKLEADEHRKALAAEKRSKRNSTTSTGNAAKRIKSEEEDEAGLNRQANIKRSKFATKTPLGWEITLDRIREFRLQNLAPVDTMGCERLAEVGDDIPPEVIYQYPPLLGSTCCHSFSCC